MCDKNSNLNKAILTQVQEFANNSTTFSIHDTTVALRNKANAGNLNLPEFENQIGQYKYNIPHKSVKTAFLELLSDGIFAEIGLDVSSQYNGVYNEYTATVTTPTQPPVSIVSSPVANVTITNPPFTPTSQSVTVNKKSKQEVESKVSNYLDSHTGKQVSIEQIRAAIKCNGWTCAEILDIVKTQYPNNTQLGTNYYPSKELVVA